MLERFRSVSPCLGLVLALGCDEPKDDMTSPPAKSASLSPAPTVAASAPAAAASANQPTLPKPKKQLEDCPTTGNVSFDNEAIEQEVRRKLAKPSGDVSLADLKRLRSLNISQQRLTELDPCLFSPMTGLKELFLGTGTYDDLSSIAGATGLESLRAAHNQVSDVSPLSKMTKMDRLDLSHSLVKDLSPLASMKNLTELQLDDTPVEDLMPLAGLTLLELVSLKNTEVKDARPLGAMKKLKFVYVRESPLEDDPSTLSPVRANGAKISTD